MQIGDYLDSYVSYYINEQLLYYALENVSYKPFLNLVNPIEWFHNDKYLCERINYCGELNLRRDLDVDFLRTFNRAIEYDFGWYIYRIFATCPYQPQEMYRFLMKHIKKVGKKYVLSPSLK